MTDIDAFLAERRRRRWMQQNAQRWLAPDHQRRFGPPPREEKTFVSAMAPTGNDLADAELAHELSRQRWHLSALRFELALVKFVLWQRKANFNPAQPRDEIGRWTDAGGGGAQYVVRPAGGINDPRIISDATPDNDWKPGAQYAANRSGSRSGGTRGPTEGGQATRLLEAQSRANAAIARVREFDPSWKPRPSAYQTPEGLIRTFNAEATEADARLAELVRNGIGFGPFTGESIAARGPERNFTSWERAEINRIGRETGCHTCGTFNPGTRSGNFVCDHQPVSALNFFGRPARLFPQCAFCSSRQGGEVSNILRRLR